MFAFLGAFSGTAVGFVLLGVFSSYVQRRETAKQLAALDAAKRETVEEYNRVYEQAKAYIDQASLADAASASGVRTVGEA